MSVCACIGPAGNCPCVRAANRLPERIFESIIPKEVFDCLSVEDKKTINDLKHHAFQLWWSKQQNTQT